MLPASSYVTSLRVFTLLCTWCKDGVKYKQSQSALYWTWRIDDVFLEKKIKRLNKCRKKQIIYQIMLGDLKFLRYWWSCLTCSVTFCWFVLHETLILLSCCFCIEMVNCLNTIILKSFVIIVSHQFFICFIVLIPPTNMYHAYFFINRIIDPITSDVMYNVTYQRDNTRQIQKK